MNGNSYLILLALFLLVIIPRMKRQRRMAAVRHALNQKKQNKENHVMKDLAKRLSEKSASSIRSLRTAAAYRALLKKSRTAV